LPGAGAPPPEVEGSGRAQGLYERLESQNGDIDVGLDIDPDYRA